MPKFKRRPNKSGSIVKLSGNRRKPFMAKIMDGYDPITGKAKIKIVACKETWEEANNALTIYKLAQKKFISDDELSTLSPEMYFEMLEEKNRSIPTFKELYDIVYEKEKDRLSFETIRNYNSIVKHLTPIYNKKINTITFTHLQDLISKENSYQVKNQMKTILGNVYKYSVIHEYITTEQDKVTYLDIGKKGHTVRKFFSYQEICELINDNSTMAKLTMIYILTGLRAKELLNIPKYNIHIDEVIDNQKISYMVAGSKTEAGKNRIIPIHNYIKNDIINLFITNRIKEVDQTYGNFAEEKFTPFMKQKNMDHTLRDTRRTFATLAQEFKLEKFSKKRIMGHKFKDLTLDVYTDTIIPTLFDEINKIDINEIIKKGTSK